MGARDWVEGLYRESSMLKQALLAGAVAMAITFSGSLAFAGGDSAKGEGAPKGEHKKGERSEAEKKKMLEKYDKDGDGKLSDEEKAAAKADRENARAEKEKGGDKKAE